MSTQASFAQRLQLAQETRKRFVAEVGLSLAELAMAVQERLASLMNEAAPAREMQHRRDAWTAYLSRKTIWQSGTLAAWKAALSPALPKPKTEPVDGFELLGTDVMDNKILASRMAQVLLEKLHAELNDLLLRIKFLVGAPEQPGPDVLQPEVLVLHMIEQWTRAGMPLESWPMVSDLVLTFLTGRLKQAYSNANASTERRTGGSPYHVVNHCSG